MSPAAASGILEANLAALGSRFPELARLLIGEADEGRPSPLSLHETPEGLPSAKLGGGWLHSPRAPREEARRLVAAALAPTSDMLVLLGFGLGYLAEAAFAAGIEQVIVCEADPAILLSALACRDLAALLGDERLGFVVGGAPDAVLSALELSGATRASLIGLRAAELALPDWYGPARAAVERWNAKGSTNENTLRRFGRLWVRNLARNLDHIGRSPGVLSLRDRFAGLPAVVLAAGPSLDETLPFIEQIAQRAVVVCVDTALRSLKRTAVEPDFLVVVDPQYWNWRHVAGLGAPRAVLVSESAAWPAVFRTPCRRSLLGGSLFPLGRRIESFTGEKGQLGAGGSVATSAWDLARLLGCEPIWMAGLDLGFPGGATHARASLFEQRALSQSRRLRPAESDQIAALCGLPAIDAPAMGGGRVRTDARMSLYAWWFEARLARSGAPRTRSLSPAGLAIPGMELGRLEELLGAPPQRARIEALMDEVADLPASDDAESRSRKGLDRLLSDLEAIAAVSEAAVEAALGARAAAAEGDEGRARLECSLRSLEAADRAILGCSAKEVAAFLMPPLGELVANRARDLGESLRQSESIYRSVVQSARYHLAALGRH